MLDGDPAPPPKKGAQPPIFGPFLLWPNGWMHQDVTWYGGRLRPRRYCVNWRPSSPKKRGTVPQFSAHVYCGLTAGWLKMPLCTGVDLGPGHIVLDGDPASLASGKGALQPRLFSAHVYCSHGRPFQLLPSSCKAVVHTVLLQEVQIWQRHCAMVYRSVEILSTVLQPITKRI